MLTDSVEHFEWVHIVSRAGQNCKGTEIPSQFLISVVSSFFGSLSKGLVFQCEVSELGSKGGIGLKSSCIIIRLMYTWLKNQFYRGRSLHLTKGMFLYKKHHTYRQMCLHTRCARMLFHPKFNYTNWRTWDEWDVMWWHFLEGLAQVLGVLATVEISPWLTVAPTMTSRDKDYGWVEVERQWMQTMDYLPWVAYITDIKKNRRFSFLPVRYLIWIESQNIKVRQSGWCSLSQVAVNLSEQPREWF